MRLAGASGRTTVVESQTIKLNHAGPKCLKILQVQQRFLLFEAARHDEDVVFNHTKFVEQAKNGCPIYPRQIDLVRAEGKDPQPGR